MPSSAMTVLRTTMIVVAVVLVLYVLYLARKPIAWLLIAVFIALALAPPVRFLSGLSRKYDHVLDVRFWA